MVTTYAVGEAARLSGLSIDTLRYYEQEGLIGPIGRDGGGRRRYDEGDVAWIGTVTCLRDAGLGIADLQRFTTLLRGEATPETRVAFLRAHAEALRERIAATEAALKVLDDKIRYYSEG
jgi:DNA-binding transcriptional MerR regulator